LPTIFDPIAAVYDQWYAMEMGQLVDTIEKDLVYRLADPQPGQRMLDIGCGTGNYSLDLARRGLRVTGIDISPAMLEVARQKAVQAGLELDLVQADITRLDLPPDYYDLVLSVTAMEFISKPEAVLARAYQSLRPGGRMVVGVIAGESPWSLFYQEHARQNPASVFNYARFYTGQQLLDLLPKGERTLAKGLFFPPDLPNFSSPKALELEGKAEGQPGFVVGLWQKV